MEEDSWGVLIGRHPGDAQEAARRHPGGTQEASRRYPGGTQRPQATLEAPGGPGRQKNEYLSAKMQHVLQHVNFTMCF